MLGPVIQAACNSPAGLVQRKSSGLCSPHQDLLSAYGVERTGTYQSAKPNGSLVESVVTIAWLSTCNRVVFALKSSTQISLVEISSGANIARRRPIRSEGRLRRNLR
jgi:hypothetical protein